MFADSEKNKLLWQHAEEVEVKLSLQVKTKNAFGIHTVSAKTTAYVDSIAGLACKSTENRLHRIGSD